MVEAAFSGISYNTLLCVWLTAVKYRKFQVWGCLGVQQMLLCFPSILQASHSFIKMFGKERKITNLWNANSLHWFFQVATLTRSHMNGLILFDRTTEKITETMPLATKHCYKFE